MNKDKDQKMEPMPMASKTMNFSSFTVLVVPPIALMGTSLPLWGMESSPVVDLARHGSFVVSVLYVVVQIVLIAVRGRPLFVNKPDK